MYVLVLMYGEMGCSVLQCVAVCCSVLQCVAVCCSVSQCVAVCVWGDVFLLQCVAVCCSVLQCVAVCVWGDVFLLQCVAVCCSVSQCVAVCVWGDVFQRCLTQHNIWKNTIELFAFKMDHNTTMYEDTVKIVVQNPKCDTVIKLLMNRGSQQDWV